MQCRFMKCYVDLEVIVCCFWLMQEQYDLMCCYLDLCYVGGGMVGMDEIDFVDMVEYLVVDI